MFILKKGHQPGVYVPLRALFLVFFFFLLLFFSYVRDQSYLKNRYYSGLTFSL